MSTTNEIWLPVNGHLVRLDLDDDTALLPSFQANDRTKPDSIQSDYSPEFSAPATAHNHRLLRHAAASQPVPGAAYTRLPCVLTSGGVETLPLGLLYVKGFSEGHYQLQLFGGNRRLVEALGDKRLRDLDLNRFNHIWNPANIGPRLSYDYYAAHGWGYELFDRGKPVDLQSVDPWLCYPSTAAWLVWQQVIADAGFTADSLLGEPLFAAMSLPTAEPYTYDSDFRDARSLVAGWRYQDGQAFSKTAEFAPQVFLFNYTARKPFVVGSALTFTAGRVTVPTEGYYKLSAALAVVFGCDASLPGEVSMKAAIYAENVLVVEHSFRDGKQVNMTLAPKADRVYLAANSVVEVRVSGDEWPSGGIAPSGPYWRVGYVRGFADPPYNPALYRIEPENRFEVEMLAEFPHNGLIRLQDWLPDISQLDFMKSKMLLLGLTMQVDRYRPHLRLATGAALLANIPVAKDWTAKRDAYTTAGRLPERDLAFRFGEYAQRNLLKWKEDDHVTPGYGDGVIAVADEVLPAENELAVLPFAATEPSAEVAGLLRIQNYERTNFDEPATYEALTPQPRLVLRTPGSLIAGRLLLTPAGSTPRPWPQAPIVTPATYADFTTTASHFAGVGLTLDLNQLVLPTYWADLRAMLDESRYLTELYRLTAQDIAGLDYSIPIWDGILGDYFAVSQVSEYDARRSVEVKLARLNAAHLPGPNVPGEGAEFFRAEFQPIEFY